MASGIQGGRDLEGRVEQKGHALTIVSTTNGLGKDSANVNDMQLARGLSLGLWDGV